MDKGCLLKKKRLCRAGFYKQEAIRGKEEGDYPNLDELPSLPPKFYSNGGVICGSPKILILIERKLGI